ncbi:MAG TPA: GNAT family N-acetyltransferase [Armatimonadota bacterium]|nr:GNAT family N-acetyltransferase [Armatimonadota bacterium]
MSEPIIRPAEEPDVPDIRRIASDAWEPIYGHFREQMGDDLYGRLYPGDPLQRKADSVEDFFRNHAEWMFVTEMDGRVVGFCTYVLKDSGVAEIGNNAVAPAAQGHGIGTAQYRECLRRMREAGMQYATVHTGLDPSHAAARRGYEKVGFTQVRPHVEYAMKL